MANCMFKPVPQAKKKEPNSARGKKQMAKILLSFALVFSAAVAGPALAPTASTEVAG